MTEYPKFFVPMASDAKFFKCCATAFHWEGKPEGQETKLAGLDAYVSGSANSDVGILLIHDIFGWKLGNLRLLTDYYARELGARVYLPDFFDGEDIPDNLLEGDNLQKFIPGFMQRHAKDIRRDSIFAAAREIRKNHKYVGASGYCYGGWACFNLGAKEHNPPGKPLVDCITTAHPSAVTKEEIESLAVPTQLIIPEHEPAFTPDLREHAQKIIPSLNLPYEYLYFPGVQHGFAAKGDPKDPVQKAAMARAMQAAAYWFKLWLKPESA